MESLLQVADWLAGCRLLLLKKVNIINLSWSAWQGSSNAPRWLQTFFFNFQLGGRLSQGTIYFSLQLAKTQHTND